ncbi:MAG: response regulator transcription factor [Clostridiales bacterium]|nr:response regulator transcription factor [Clostridiales bacterium]
MRILLAEDEVALAKALVKIFESNNYSIDAVHDGQDALDYLEAGNYDVAVLDIMMPKVDGITVLRKLRESGSDMPVLMLTAKSEIDDKVLGLDSGADYYLTKPFDAKELLAAVRAITRSGGEVDTKLSFGNITLDRASFELSAPGGSVKLANKEFQMMELLMSKPGNIVSVDKFMDHIWGYDTDTESNVVWVYVSYLRKKLTAVGADVKIKASRNAGYSLVTGE